MAARVACVCSRLHLHQLLQGMLHLSIRAELQAGSVLAAGCSCSSERQEELREHGGVADSLRCKRQPEVVLSCLLLRSPSEHDLMRSVGDTDLLSSTHCPAPAVSTTACSSVDFVLRRPGPPSGSIQVEWYQAGAATVDYSAAAGPADLL